LDIITGVFEINNNNKYKKYTSFYCHADAVGAMRSIPGFNRSHWMPPSGECSYHIAVAAAVVDDFGRKHKTLTKNYF
jgi:hypothetical protein